MKTGSTGAYGVEARKYFDSEYTAWLESELDIPRRSMVGEGSLVVLPINVRAPTISRLGATGGGVTDSIKLVGGVAKR